MLIPRQGFMRLRAEHFRPLHGIHELMYSAGLTSANTTSKIKLGSYVVVTNLQLAQPKNKPIEIFIGEGVL